MEEQQNCLLSGVAIRCVFCLYDMFCKVSNTLLAFPNQSELLLSTLFYFFVYENKRYGCKCSYSLFLHRPWSWGKSSMRDQYTQIRILHFCRHDVFKCLDTRRLRVKILSILSFHGFKIKDEMIISEWFNILGVFWFVFSDAEFSSQLVMVGLCG